MSKEYLLLIGWGLNTLCFTHFIYKNGFKLGARQVAITLFIFLFPFLGTLLYLVWYVWIPPSVMKDNLKAKSIYGNNYSLIETDKSRTPSLKHLKKVEQQNKLEQFLEKGQKLHFSVFGKYRHPVIRIGLFMFGVIVSAFGVNSIMNGDMTYKNHYGLTVFGPFSILIGVLCIYVAIFKWKNVKEDL